MADNPKKWYTLLPILMGNLLGIAGFCSFIAIFRPELTEAAATIILSKSLFAVICNSFCCGMLMYIAVAIFKQNSNLGILMCIPAFILSGFEHCIAFVGYCAIAGMFNWTYLLYLLIAILGNSLGSIFLSIISNYIKEK